MVVAQVASGTQAATVGTLHVLHAPTTLGKTFVLYVDCTALTGTDVVEIGVRDKTLSTSALAVVRTETLAGVQAEPVLMTVPLPSVHGCDFTLRQTAGTGRSYPFSLRSLD